MYSFDHHKQKLLLNRGFFMPLLQLDDKNTGRCVQGEDNSVNSTRMTNPPRESRGRSNLVWVSM